MKHLVRIVMLLLALGVASTFIAGAACGYWRDVDMAVSVGISGSGQCAWHVSIAERSGVRQMRGDSLSGILGGLPITAEIQSQFGISSITHVPWPLTECRSSLPAGAVAIEKRCGWPWLALRGGVIFEPDPSFGFMTVAQNRGCYARWRNDPATGVERVMVVPIVPVWPDFIWSSILYAIAWGIVIGLVRLLRPAVITITPHSLRTAALSCLALGFLTSLLSIVCCVFLVDAPGQDGGPGETRGTSFRGDHYRVWWLNRAVAPGVTRWESRWISGGDEIGIGPTNITPAEGLDPRWAAFLRPRAGTDIDKMSVIAEARGWPWPVLAGGYEIVRESLNSNARRPGETYWCFVIENRTIGSDLDPKRARIVPYRPLWGALACNVLAFSAAWAAAMLILIGPAAMRRSIRHHRGLCLHCGYDLREIPSDRCPECGSLRMVDAANEPSIR